MVFPYLEGKLIFCILLNFQFSISIFCFSLCKPVVFNLFAEMGLQGNFLVARGTPVHISAQEN